MLEYGSTLAGAAKTGESTIADEDTSWWKTLQERRSDQDYHLALERLAADGAFQNRVAAAMILANFSDRDPAWQALMEGVRDPNGLVRIACYQVLARQLLIRLSGQDLGDDDLRWKSWVARLDRQAD